MVTCYLGKADEAHAHLLCMCMIMWLLLIVNKHTSSCLLVMHLLWCLFSIYTQYNIILSAEHLAGSKKSGHWCPVQKQCAKRSEYGPVTDAWNPNRSPAVLIGSWQNDLKCWENALDHSQWPSPLWWSLSVEYLRATIILRVQILADLGNSAFSGY